MKLGIIQQIGGPLELYNNPNNKFVAGFIGSPPMNFMTVEITAEGTQLHANEGSFRIKLNEKQNSLLAPYVGKKVTFGIRPEDVKFADKAIEDTTINGQVSVIEPLGSETHIYVTAGRHQFVGKIEPDIRLTVDQDISLIPDLAKVKFFDHETELAIR